MKAWMEENCKDSEYNYRFDYYMFDKNKDDHHAMFIYMSDDILAHLFVLKYGYDAKGIE
jgi:hypothetical protein